MAHEIFFHDMDSNNYRKPDFGRMIALVGLCMFHCYGLLTTSTKNCAGMYLLWACGGGETGADN